MFRRSHDVKLDHYRSGGVAGGQSGQRIGYCVVPMQQGNLGVLWDEIPTRLYRYFDNEKHADGFTRGSVWIFYA